MQMVSHNSGQGLKFAVIGPFKGICVIATAAQNCHFSILMANTAGKRTSAAHYQPSK